MMPNEKELTSFDKEFWTQPPREGSLADKVGKGAQDAADWLLDKNQKIDETVSIGEVRDRHNTHIKKEMNRAVVGSLSQERTLKALMTKLATSKDPIELEIGKNAAQLASRAYAVTKEGGATPKQSAVWGASGTVAVAVALQMKVASSMPAGRPRQNSADHDGQPRFRPEAD